MASTPVEARSGRIGISGGKLELYPLGSDTLANSVGGDNLIEETNRSGTYQAIVTEALIGTYEAYCLTGTNIFYLGLVDMADDILVHSIVDGITARMIFNPGAGPFTVTVTVDDGVNPLENVIISYTKNLVSYQLPTDVNGIATFNLTSGTWSYIVNKSGYVIQTGTLLVDGNKTPSFTLVAVTIPASTPGTVVGYLYVYDHLGVIEVGVPVDIRVARKSLVVDGMGYDSKIRTEVSDGLGKVTFSNLFPSITYELRRSSSRKWFTHNMAAAPADPFQLSSIIGEE